MNRGKYNFPDLILKAHEKKKEEYRRLSTLTVEQIDQATSQLIQDIFVKFWSEGITMTNSSRINATITVFSLIKLRTDHYEKLIKILERLLPGAETDIKTFIYYVYTKLAKHVQRKHVEAKLNQCDFYSVENSLPNAYFLLFLVRNSPGSVLFCTQEFLNAATKAIFSKVNEIMKIGYESIKLFLIYLNDIRTPQIQTTVYSLFSKASAEFPNRLLTHGALYIFSVIFETAPKMVPVETKVFAEKILYPKFQYTKDEEDAALNVIVLLWLFDNKSISETEYQKLCTRIWAKNLESPTSFSTMALLRLLKNNSIKIDNEKTFPAINSILLSQEKQTYLNGTEILLETASLSKFFINRNAMKLSKLILNILLLGRPVKCFSPIFKEFTLLWDYFKPIFKEKLENDLTFLENINVLEFIATIESINSEKVTNKLLMLFGSPYYQIRAVVPSAILAQYNITRETVNIIQLNKIFALIVADPSAFMREKALLCFPEECIQFLTTNEIMENCAILMKDESLEVRNAAIKLLGKIAKFNPFHAFPILRKVILDFMINIDTPKPLLAKEEMSNSLQSLLVAAFDIFAPYSQTFCDIVLRQISFQANTKLTYFEEKALLNLNINLIKVIGFIAEKDISCLGDHVKQFHNFFMWLLPRHSPKKYIIAVVTAMHAILTHYDHLEEIDLPRVFSVLIEISSVYNSKKLNVAVLKLMGFIGAIDTTAELEDSEETDKNNDEYVIESLEPHSLDDYFMDSACCTLLRVLKEESAITHTDDAINSLVEIFSYANDFGAEHFKTFMEILLEKVSSGKLLEFTPILKKICLTAPTTWVAPYASKLMSMIQTVWNPSSPPMLIELVDFIPIFANVLLDNFLPYLSEFTSLLLNCLTVNAGTYENLSNKTILVLMALRSISILDYLTLVITDFIQLINSPITLDNVKIQLLVAIRVFIQNCDCLIFVSPITRSAISALSSTNHNVVEAALQVIYSLIVVFGKHQFDFYIDIVRDTLIRGNNSTDNLVKVLTTATDGSKCSDFPFIKTNDPSLSLKNVFPKPQQPYFNEENYLKECNFESFNETPWNRREWWHKFVSATINFSPSLFIRSCSFLADSLFSTAEIILMPAFLSCWKALSPDGRMQMNCCLTVASLSSQLPSDIKSSLAKLFEFMEQRDEKIEIESSVILEACEDSSQYSKALYFAHRAYYMKSDDLKNIENLIRLSSHLGLNKTVKGLSLLVDNMTMEPTWCEHLGQWEKAKKLYLQSRNNGKEQEINANKGIIRCLEHQKKWDEIIGMIDYFKAQSNDVQKEVMPIIASALFHRQMWDQLKTVLDKCSMNSSSTLIIKAIYETCLNNKEKALEIIETAYEVLASSSRAIFKHDKTALYPIIVKAQQLCEIKEIITKKENILNVWENRTNICKEDFDLYHKILSIRLTYTGVENMMKPALKMLKIALNRHDIDNFDSTLQFLFPNKEKWPMEVQFLHIKRQWEGGDHKEAINQLMKILPDPNNHKPSHLSSRMLYCCANWLLSESKSSSQFQYAVSLLEAAIKDEFNYYNAWHRLSWACSIMYKNKPDVHQHAFNAEFGFSKCVQLSPEYSFSDLIQLTALVFSERKDFTEEENKKADEIAKGLAAFPPSILLQIKPQLFAQLAKPNNGTQARLAVSIIASLIQEHYHILMPPLLFLAKSITEGRPQEEEDEDMFEEEEETAFSALEDQEVIEGRKVIRYNLQNCTNLYAKNMIEKFFVTNPKAVIDSLTICNGLIQCSTSRIEDWHEMAIFALVAINRKDKKRAMGILTDAISLPVQPGEDSMTNKFKDDLVKCVSLFFMPQDNIQALSEMIHKFISDTKKYLADITQIKMYNVAPKLATLRDSILAVPGTYYPGCPIIRIQQFESIIEIMHSKQRPRFLMITDQQGNSHRSLLKGHEDLRMDQRVMQFFMLMNQHINHHFPSESRNLHIFRYEITPISKKAGLIQFVDGAETMFSLITSYRESHGIEPFAENTKIKDEIQCKIDYLTPIQRLEVLEDAASVTDDTDLRNVIWLKSPSSNEWISRYIRFAQSSAIMSIVGYIIGLGDRHPSNLMIHNTTGSIIHIDFGDCFDVTKNRIRFQEVIPFRLTRMMCSAFGPTRIEGDFRMTCEETLLLVRNHSNSIMAVLDIFLQEPLEIDKQNAYLMKSHQENVDDGIEVRYFDENVPASINESMKTIQNKIQGTNPSGNGNLTVPTQVQNLITSATDLYNLAHLYHGWTPLW